MKLISWRVKGMNDQSLICSRRIVEFGIAEPEPLIGFPKPRLAYFPLIYADKNLAHKLFLKE
jgi:hypothetical protein